MNVLQREPNSRISLDSGSLEDAHIEMRPNSPQDLPELSDSATQLHAVLLTHQGVVIFTLVVGSIRHDWTTTSFRGLDVLFRQFRVNADWSAALIWTALHCKPEGCLLHMAAARNYPWKSSRPQLICKTLVDEVS